MMPTPSTSSGPIPSGHPALVRQEPTPTPPPEPLNMSPPPMPPDNPQTEEDRQKVARYEMWLSQQEDDINKRLKYYELEIAKLRKQRKVRICKTISRLVDDPYNVVLKETIGLWTCRLLSLNCSLNSNSKLDSLSRLCTLTSQLTRETGSRPAHTFLSFH
jgi:hypothetical protein